MTKEIQSPSQVDLEEIAAMTAFACESDPIVGNEKIYTDFDFMQNNDFLLQPEDTVEDDSPVDKPGPQWGCHDVKPVSQIQWEKALENEFEKITYDLTDYIPYIDKDTLDKIDNNYTLTQAIQTKNKNNRRLYRNKRSIKNKKINYKMR